MVPIYSQSPVELERFKMYIENNLTNNFIKLSKSSTRIVIFLDKKPDQSLRLIVDYRGLNNLIIKNQYSWSLLEKSIDQLGRTWRFT